MRAIIEGHFGIEARDASGASWTPLARAPNLITTAGKDYLRDLLVGRRIRPRYIAIGTGTTAAAAGDTALQTEVSREIIRRRSFTAGKATFQAFLDFSEGNGSTYSEAGLFDVSASGTMLSHIVFSGVPKTSGIQMTFTWDITIS